MNINPDNYNAEDEDRPDHLSYYMLGIPNHENEDIVDLQVLLTDQYFVVEILENSLHLPILTQLDAIKNAIEYACDRTDKQIDEPFNYRIRGVDGTVSEGLQVKYKLDDLRWTKSNHLLCIGTRMKYICTRDKKRSRVVNNYKESYISLMIAESLMSQVIDQQGE